MIFNSLLIMLAAFFPPLQATDVSGRKLALLVGVGQYRDPGLNQLHSPPKDAERLGRLLSEKFHFETTLLIDQAATRDGFLALARQKLVTRTKPEDIVLVYFSGHGSQIQDLDGDEADGYDEALVFHDAKGLREGHLLDDDLFHLIDSIPAQHIVVIIDACHSGGGNRQDSKSSSTKVTPPMLEMEKKPNKKRVVWLTATTHASKLAKANVQSSLFTGALLKVLNEPNSDQLSYLQLIQRLNRYQKEMTQTANVLGAKNSLLFRNREKPRSWEIVNLESAIQLRGLPWPGWTEGAICTVFSAHDAFRGSQPAKPKSRLKLIAIKKDQAHAIAELLPGGSVADLAVGDQVFIETPGPGMATLNLAFEFPSISHGFTNSRKKRFKKVIESNQVLAGHVKFVGITEADYTLMAKSDRDIGIQNPKNVPLVTIPDDDLDVFLQMFLIQKDLRAKAKTMGQNPGNRLRIEIVPTEYQGCGMPSGFDLQKGRVPLCTFYRVKVHYLPGGQDGPLQISGLILSSSGSIFGWPEEGATILHPGESKQFSEVFKAVHPLEATDVFLAFGTSPDLKNDYSHVSLEPDNLIRERGNDDWLPDLLKSHFYQRGGELVRGTSSTWMMASYQIRVIAPPSPWPRDSSCNCE